MKTYLKIIFSMLLFSLLIPLFAKAITFENPFEANSFEELIDVVINFIFWVAIAIVPIMIIVAAYFFLTSGGDPAKVGQAKKVILYTFIGLIIALSGRGIVSIITGVIGGGGPGPGPVCVPSDGCNWTCPASCAGNPADPDCVCQTGNGCCGTGCTHFTGDDDCGITPAKLAALGDMNGNCVLDVADAGLLGDLNGDGVVDMCDGSIFQLAASNSWTCWQPITQAVLSKLGETTNDCYIDASDSVGDLNGDGVINACDGSIFQIAFMWQCD